MEFSRNMQKVMERAVKLAAESRHRYFMPEHVIYGMTFDEDFFGEYQAFGGDIEKLRQDILGFLKEQAGTAQGENAVLTADTDRVIRMSEGQARASGRGTIDVSHFLAAVLQLEDCYGVYYLAVQGVDLVEVAGEMSRESLLRERNQGSQKDNGQWANVPDGEGDINRNGKTKGGGPGRDEHSMGASMGWRRYVEDMIKTCMDKNPLIGREADLERTIQILCRKDKNNVLHVGEPGVGKTAVAYGLARKIVSGQVPEPLKQAAIVRQDPG